MELSVIQKTYGLYRHFILINGKMPKIYRYNLGDKTLGGVLELLELLIEAKHAGRNLKVPYLLKANAKLEILRFNLRIYLDEKLANETQIFQLQRLLQDIGRELGGWLKSNK